MASIEIISDNVKLSMNTGPHDWSIIYMADTQTWQTTIGLNQLN